MFIIREPQAQDLRKVVLHTKEHEMH